MRIQTGTDALAYFLGPDGSGEVSANRTLFLLLDLNLPDMSGMSILQRLKANEHTRRVPAMVLTTPDDSREIQHCQDPGCNAYATKPVTRRRL